MSHKMLRPFIVKVSVLRYFPLQTEHVTNKINQHIYTKKEYVNNKINK